MSTIQEITRDETYALAMPAQQRAEYFSNRYFIFAFQGYVGRPPTDEEKANASIQLGPWFAENPKRLIPSREQLLPLFPTPIKEGRRSVTSLFEAYQAALSRDISQQVWR